MTREQYLAKLIEVAARVDRGAAALAEQLVNITFDSNMSDNERDEVSRVLKALDHAGILACRLKNKHMAINQS